MAAANSAANVDATLGTGLVTIVPAPSAGQYKKVALTICNAAAADATFDLARYDGANIRYMGKTVPAAVGKPVVLTEIILAPGFALQARASAASTLDLTADVQTLTGA